MDWLRRVFGKGDDPASGSGSVVPRALSSEEIEEARMRTRFQEREIVILWKRFAGLGLDSEERVDVAAVGTLPELCHNPYTDRILLHFFQCDDHGRLSFTAFLDGVYLLSDKSGWEAKLYAAFAVQDMDGDGAISRADLARYLSRAMPCDIRADIEEAVMDGLELAEGGGAEKEEKGEKEGEREAPSPGAAASPTLGKDKASAPPTTGPTDKDAVTAAQLLRVVDGAFADLHLDAETGVLDRHAFIQACNLTAYQKYVISFV